MKYSTGPGLFEHPVYRYIYYMYIDIYFWMDIHSMFCI